MANTKRTRQTAPKGTMKKVLNYVGRHGFFIAVSMILAVVIVALTLYAPILIGNAIDEIAGKDNVDFSNVAQILMKTAVVIGITAVLQWVMNAINNRITYHVVRDIRNAAFRHIEVLPLSYIDANPYGDIVNRVIADADQFSEGLLMGFTQLFTGVATIVGALIFMFTISWPIAVVVVVATPLSLFVAKFIASRTYRMFRLQTETRGKQTAFIDEMIGNQKVVQTFSHEEKSLRDFDVINDRLAEYSLKATFYSSLSNPSTRFVNSVIYAGVALCGALMCISSAGTAAAFTIGQLSCCLSYTNQYTKPFNEISGVITELQNSLACAARLFELIEEKPQVEEPADAVKLTDVKGSVELDNVSFSYVPDRKLIEDLSLTVKPGQRVAIVGPTGCGKTTIINLLMRFYDVNGGSVSVEGSDIRNVTRRSLRESYGMVLQETWLKSGTIRDNIVMGKPDATDEEVIAAAKASHAHSFIKRMPQGYDTVIGEDGGSLSQGQKQLLCITRVMLTLPPMLILDEATSNIDTRTELQVQDAFDKLMRGKTSFVVAHRLSTIRNASLILVMKDGKIIEQGTHDELTATNCSHAAASIISFTTASFSLYKA